MRKSRFAVAALGMSVLLLCAAPSHADLISLNNTGGNQSNVEAGAGGDFDFQNTSNNVNSLPYTTPVTFTSDTTSTSTTTPNLSQSALTATFSQLYVTDGSETDGHIDVFFTANANLNYSISGLETVVGNTVEGTLNSYLVDQTADKTVYSDEESFFDLGNAVKPATPVEDTNVLNLNNASDETGSMTGSLVAGDTYEFFLSEEMDNIFDDPNLTGNGGITFAAQTPPGGGSSIPLPLSAPAALIALLPLALWMKRAQGVRIAD